MTETRPYYSTRQLINVDEFLTQTGDYYLVCLSAAQIYALRVMAKTRLLWPTTWAKEQYEQTYLLPDAADWDQIDAHVSDFIVNTERIDMCNNALISALQDIRDVIRQSSCCYEGGIGLIESGEQIYFGSEEPLSEPTAFGEGEEFETEQAWLDHKCAVANGIVNAVIGSLNGLSVLSLFSLTAAAIVAGLVGLGLIFVPPVAVLAALLAGGFVLGGLTALADAIDENRSDIVCAIYNSTTATEAYDAFKDAVEALSIDLGIVEINVRLISDLVMQLAPIDTFNKLYTAVGLPSVPGDVVECDTECADTCEAVLVNMGTALGDEEYLSEKNTSPNDHDYVSVYFNYEPGVGYCGDPVALTTTLVSNPTGQSIWYRVYNQAGSLIYNNVGTAPGPLANVGIAEYKTASTANAGTHFTVRLEVS